MGQQEIMEFLEEQYKIDSEKYFTQKEISKAVGNSPGSCSTCLKKLRKYNEVEYHIGTSIGGKKPYYYRHKLEE